LTRVFPIMTGVRGAVRAGQLVLAAIALLAGFGWAWLYRRLERRAYAIGIVLLLGTHLEALRAPIQYRVFRGISPIFDSLKTGDRKLIACFPFPGPLQEFQNADCLLASTRFWQPLVNGYSSFIPASYYREAAALGAFPEDATLPYLKQLGVTHVIVFVDKMSAPRLAHLSEHPELSLWTADKSVRIYVLQ
ncbi:MAG TPA: hypothetical protein VN797_04235, partial [Gemmatimonadaceae bacterium]|nr:hypothetical protein [Gemmatimonadaceae bacterium]